MSIRTGPGRPLRAMWNASCTTRGISVGCWIMNECLTIGMVMPNVSASWKPSVPSRSVRTWPVKNTTGTESIIASVSGVTMFVAPGPDVAKHTPTLPDALAYPSAACPPPASWRTRMCLMPESYMAS